jgi:quercetin dioxygenase-like cupin family protein
MTQNPNVEARTPQPPVDLDTLGRQLLQEARTNDNGRSALTLTPAEGGPLKQTLLAITAGNALAEHAAPGSATIQVLQGAATVTGEGEQRLDAGQWSPIPRTRHGVRADEDVVALLTVVTAT